MKAEDLKTKTEDELKKTLLDLRKEQFNMRFQRTQGSLENTAQLRNVRRTIARVKTFLNQTQTGQPAAKKPEAKKAAPAKKPAAKKKSA